MKRKGMYRITVFLNSSIFFLILLFGKSTGADPQYEACVLKRCDKGPNISYPFYIQGVQESFCGLFGLNCSNSGFPIIQVAENAYVIENIFYHNRSFLAYNAAVDNLVSNCLSEIRNITPTTPGSQIVFDSSLSSLLLFSGCTEPLLEKLNRYEVACDYNPGSGWELAMLKSDENLSSALEECETNVVAPVELHGYEARNGVVDYEGLLRRGFALNWKASFCSKCKETGGHCGISTTTNGFRCFCPYGPEYYQCKSTQEYEHSNSTCPTEFECNNLGALKFPFANFSEPHCGLCMVDCRTRPSTIKLSWFSGQIFHFISVSQGNIIKLFDPFLHQLLNPKPNCSLFLYNIDLPKSPSILFTIKFNITLFRCSKGPSLTREVHNYFIRKQYRKYEACGEFDLYYRNPKYNCYGTETDLIPPPGCSSIHLPMHSWENVSEDTELFQLFSDDFDLEWHLGDRCRNCHNRGGRCETDTKFQFRCAYGTTSTGSLAQRTKKLKIILATAIPGGAVLVIFLAIVLVLCCKKGIKNPFYLRSRTFSKPFSKPDLEGGSVYFGIPVFSYAELEAVTNNFDASKELGDGGFGTVYYGKLRDGREVAVKRLYEHNFKRMAQFMNEVEILTRLRHRNLVSLYGCTSRRSRELLLVYEYIPNGTVADHLHGDRAKDQSLAWPVRMNIAIETADALAYLHASDIIHRDVKTNNILLDHNFCVKVADFGLSRLFPNDVSHVSTAPQGTPGYVDPEYHQCYQLTDKSDVYSFGVVLIELISSMPAVDISRHRHEINLANLAINRIERCAFNELIDPSLGYESDPEVMRMTTSVAKLAFRCLQLEKEMRPTMDEVLETLRAIQDYNENFVEKTNETNENTAESGGRLVPLSPETDEVVLLKKNMKCPSSPNSVTDLWASSSSTTSSSI